MNMRQSRAAPFDKRVSRQRSGQGRATTALRASYEQYLALAKAKALAGDQIEAERYYQYAEHYHRLSKQ